MSSVGEVGPSLVISQGWFFEIERTEAEQLVSQGAPGCFLVRPSSKAGSFALTYKARDDGTVSHALLSERPGGYSLEGQQLVFANVHALLLALSLQKNNIAWEQRLFNTDRVDDDDIRNDAPDTLQHSQDALYANIDFHLVLAAANANADDVPGAAAEPATLAATEFGGSMAALQRVVAVDGEHRVYDKRLLNGVVTILCALSTGGDAIECRFPATASGKQVKSALIDCAPSLLAFQPRDLELEIDVEPRLPVNDFDRFVELSEQVLDAYFAEEPIKCFLRVPQVDTGDLELDEPEPVPVSVIFGESLSEPLGEPLDELVSAPPDALEALARSKQLPPLPVKAKSPPVVAVSAPVAATLSTAVAEDVAERAHTFDVRFVGRPVECHECKKVVWSGRSSEIYVCALCSFACHKTCVSRVQSNCSEVARLSAVLVDLKPVAKATDVASVDAGTLLRRPRLRVDTLSSGSVRLRAGWLVKRGGSFKSWKRRWCVVRRGELSYFKDRDATEPLHTISFVGAKLKWPASEADSVIDGRKHCFTVDTEQRVWCFQAASAADLRDWLESVQAHVQHADRLRASDASSAAAAAATTTAAMPSARVSGSSGRVLGVAAAAASVASNQAASNSSGALFDVGHSAIGTDAGSEIFQWNLDSLLQRRVAHFRWPAGAAYVGPRLRHPGTVFGLVRKLSAPAWADVDRSLQRSGAAVGVSTAAPPFRVAVIESADSQYFRAKMQRLIERQLDSYAPHGASCLVARRVSPSSSSLLRNTGAIVRVSVLVPVEGGESLVQLSVPILTSASQILALAVARVRVGGGTKRTAPLVRATSMALVSAARSEAATTQRRSVDDSASESELFGVLGGERTSEVDKAAARALVLRIPETDEFVLSDDTPLCALQYTADFLERCLGARELTFVAVRRQWLLDNVDADDRALLSGEAGKPPLSADAARDMLALSLDDAALFQQADDAGVLQRQEYLPAEACDKMFELRVIAMEHFALAHLLRSFERADVDRGNVLMYVELGLFYGEQLLCPKVYTHPIAAPAKPYWNEWLVCAARVRDLRRETRAVLTFYAYNERRDVAVALGWVAMPVFDHSAALRQGIVRLGLWSQTAANPLVMTDNAAADATLAAIVMPRMPPDVPAPRDWFGCGARLFAAHVAKASAKHSSSQRSSQRTSQVAQKADSIVRLFTSDEEYDAAIAGGAVGCRRCRRVYPTQGDVDFHNQKRHQGAGDSSTPGEATTTTTTVQAGADDDVVTDEDAARRTEEAEQEQAYMRISVQLPRLPVPVCAEPSGAALAAVLGGGVDGDHALWKAETDAAPEQTLAERSQWRKLLSSDQLCEFTHDERRFVWRFRAHLLRDLAVAQVRSGAGGARGGVAECEMCATGRDAIRVTPADGAEKQLCSRCAVAFAAAVGVAPGGASGGELARAIAGESSFSLSGARAAWLLVRAAPWHEPDAAARVYALLRAMPRLDGRSALVLLDGCVVDEVVRAYAVACLATLSDAEYRQLLLPLVSALKYERSHWSPLAHWLLMRALANRRLCGAALFWTLRAELHRPVHSERLALLLEAYLAAAGEHECALLYRQCWLDAGLHATATLVRREREHAARTTLLRSSLGKSPALARVFAGAAALPLPTDAYCVVRGVVPDRCRWLQSFTCPLWIELTGGGSSTTAAAAAALAREQLIFKAGDDLRQDLLTLLVLRQLNRVWQLDGLDMRMTLYDVLPTGAARGFIQVVPNTKTTAELQQAAGGVAAVFRRNVIADWLRSKNESPLQYKRAVDNFMRSCAAYCVATYLVGIQDRHNDNIMVAESGHLLHIDFAHFLGRVMRFGAFNREKAPFVLTPAMAFVIGDESSPLFADFVALCCRAFNAARRHAVLFFGLFQLMLHAGIPQLESRDDLLYLRKSFALHLNDRDAAAHYAALLRESLSSSRAQINGAIHILAKRRK